MICIFSPWYATNVCITKVLTGFLLLKSGSLSSSSSLYLKDLPIKTIIQLSFELRCLLLTMYSSNLSMRNVGVYEFDWWATRSVTSARSAAGGPAPEPSLPSGRFTKKGYESPRPHRSWTMHDGISFLMKLELDASRTSCAAGRTEQPQQNPTKAKISIHWSLTHYPLLT